MVWAQIPIVPIGVARETATAGSSQRHGKDNARDLLPARASGLHRLGYSRSRRRNSDRAAELAGTADDEHAKVLITSHTVVRLGCQLAAEAF
jgi:hypothetical protein